MTQPNDPLHEPLRLLRESPLAAGFEERLAARLASVHRTGPATPSRLSGHRRAILLLAAIAIPAAAFASGGWLLEHRGATTTTIPDASRVAKPLPKIVDKALGLPPRVSPPHLPKIDEQTARVPSDVGSERSTPRVASEPRVTRESAQTGERKDTVPAANAPAKIESLDVSIPRSSSARTSNGHSAEQLPSDALGLRKANEQGANRSSVERNDSRSQRGNAGEHRGSDAAQQARERVQARERKGQ